jgi:hypothetical protein
MHRNEGVGTARGELYELSFETHRYPYTPPAVALKILHFTTQSIYVCSL